MTNLWVETVSLLLMACSLVIANMKLTIKSAPIKRILSPGRYNI